MATLTEAAYYTRRTINWAIVAVIVYIIVRLFWSILVAIFLILFPPKPIPPNHAFNKLPPISFPAPKASPSAQFLLQLETITGSLPVISSPSGVRVYFMPKAAANLLAISRTESFAKLLGFDSKPIQESKTLYRFEDSKAPLRKLRYDIVSNNFVLRYGYEQDTGIFSEGKLDDPQKVETEAIETLERNSIYAADFQNGTRVISYIKLVGNTLVPVANVSDVNAMRVDFFRGSVSKFKLMTPNPNEGQIHMIFSPSEDSKKKIIEMRYTYWPLDYETYATYPLKPISIAWQELQNGNGFIAEYPINGNTTGVIRNVYLAYFDSFTPQTYLQPIYVFEGDYGFKAYVPAIASEWIE